MKPSQRKSPGLPAGKPPVPLTEAQTTFAVVLGQCVAKEWIRLSVRSTESSGPTKPNSRPPNAG